MNELLSSLFDRNTKAEPSDDEYVGEDGLFLLQEMPYAYPMPGGVR